MLRYLYGLLGALLVSAQISPAFAQSLNPVDAFAYSSGGLFNGPPAFQSGDIEASATFVHQTRGDLLTSSAYGNLRLMSFEVTARHAFPNLGFVGGLTNIRDRLFFESQSGTAAWLPFRVEIDAEAQGAAATTTELSKADIAIRFNNAGYRYVASKRNDGTELFGVNLLSGLPEFRLTSFDRTGFNGEILVGPGGLTTVNVWLEARAENNAYARGNFRFGELPAGISFTSASGNFLAGVTAVPEPATWAQMIAGFLLMGAAARRRNLLPSRAVARAPHIDRI